MPVKFKEKSCKRVKKRIYQKKKKKISGTFFIITKQFYFPRIRVNRSREYKKMETKRKLSYCSHTQRNLVGLKYQH